MQRLRSVSSKDRRSTTITFEMHPHRLETSLAPRIRFCTRVNLVYRNETSLPSSWTSTSVSAPNDISTPPWHESDENNITHHHRNLLTRHPTCTHTFIGLPFTATCAREKRESRLVVEIEMLENPSVNRQDGDVKITVGKPWGGPDFYSTYDEF